MGIVCYCPNGHRVKVKDHLAGKTGICPSCEARFRIPLATGTTADTAQGQSPSGLPIAAVVSLDPILAAALPPALVLADSETSPSGSVTTPTAIAEAPTASWCIAVPGGQPSDAMSGSVLLEWLTSGTVTGGELVWRSDWSDWRPIAEVFPDHVPPAFPQPRATW